MAQGKDKLIAAGTAFDETTGVGTFALARFTRDGTLDPTFGYGGEVTTGFDFDLGDDQAFALALQPDGKLIATGIAFPENSTADIGLVPYNPDGTLDPTFGTDGKVTTDFGLSASGRALAIQPNGRLVVAAAIGGNTSFALVRYRG